MFDFPTVFTVPWNQREKLKFTSVYKYVFCSKCPAHRAIRIISFMSHNKPIGGFHFSVPFASRRLGDLRSLPGGVQAVSGAGTGMCDPASDLQSPPGSVPFCEHWPPFNPSCKNCLSLCSWPKLLLFPFKYTPSASSCSGPSPGTFQAAFLFPVSRPGG